jgi:hypothetical protein
VIAARRYALSESVRNSAIPCTCSARKAVIALKLFVSSAARFRAFYGTVMQLEPAGKYRCRCGDSLLIYEEYPKAAQDTPLRANGYRYFTIQVAFAG